ncbi:helix-turn-helix domain-containing protein [Noviherbaspirillum sp. 1P10PC]|uniref:helix-turn-helix domain-containing protein n=1 Tax=Noviherbaspirillum sp. 1P10PC TaxID=3132292 RepID=UPI0039A253B8
MTTPIRTTGQLGPVLRSLRKARGWSQAELGRRVGLSQERISAIESRPEKVNLDTLLTLAMALDAELSIGARVQAATAPASGEQW